MLSESQPKKMVKTSIRIFVCLGMKRAEKSYGEYDFLYVPTPRIQDSRHTGALSIGYR